jgi:CubicO group peptidase (beta-lactamase class C family)
MPLAPVALLAVCVAAQAPAASAADDPGRFDRWLASAGFQGSALVVKGDAILLRKGYGLSDREAGVPYDAGTVWSLGSITK